MMDKNVDLFWGQLMKTFIIILFPFLLLGQPSRILILMEDETPGSFEPEVIAYNAALATPLTAAYKDTLDMFVKMLKDSLGLAKGASNLNTVFDRMWDFASQNSTAALTDMTALSVATAVNSPTFAAYRGFTGNGSTSYINSNYNPTGSALVSQNTIAFGLYSRTNSNEASNDMGATEADGNGISLSTRSGEYLYTRNNGAISSAYDNSDSRGLFISSRLSSTAYVNYKNGAVHSNVTNNSVGVVNLNLYLLARNANGTPSFFTIRQIALVFISKGLTATEARKLNNCIEWYLDTKGAGVQ